MGRKIPGRKHRGIRDPEKQAAVRHEKIKDKINAAPSNPDEQQIPKSLQRIIELKNKVKNGDFNKRRKKVEDKENVKKSPVLKMKPEKPIPTFKQHPGETDRGFVQRMNNICMDMVKEAKFEEKYGVDITRNKDGEVESVVKRPKDELEILLKKVRKEKKLKENKKIKKKKKDEKNEVPKLSKSQKWALKKKEKKMKKKSHNLDEFKRFKDEVKFGETVHAPPTLVAPRKVEKTLNAPRPGKKPLLLKAVMKNELSRKKSLQSQTETKPQKVLNKVTDKKGKRKALPHALRRQLEKTQKEVISAYKELKMKKFQHFKT